MDYLSCSNNSNLSLENSNMTTMVVYEAVIASILTTTTVISFLANFIIIIIFTKYKCLRTKHDMLVINLAFTNLIITIGVSFYSTYTLNPGDVLHMKLVCLNLFVFIFGGILSSLLVLLWSTLERYVCIIHPEFHARIKRRHIICLSLLAYVVGLIYTVIPFLFKNNWDRHQLCVADVFPIDFSIAEQIIGIFIIVAIIILNIVVFKAAISQAKKINTLLKNVQNKHTRKRKYRQKGKAFVTVFLLSIISAVCWIPLLVVFGLESDPELKQELRWIFTQLLYVPVSLNSCITAFIIGHRNSHFWDAIKATFCRRQHECYRRPMHYYLKP